MSGHEDDADPYAGYRELGRIKAAEFAEGANRFNATIAGMLIGFAEARSAGPRPKDDTRLPFDVAWECAHAEYGARAVVVRLSRAVRETEARSALVRQSCVELRRHLREAETERDDLSRRLAQMTRIARHPGDRLLRERNEALESVDRVVAERDDLAGRLDRLQVLVREIIDTVPMGLWMIDFHKGWEERLKRSATTGSGVVTNEEGR